MAPKKAAPAPSAESLEHLWEALRQSREPVTAAQLVKALEPPHKLREAVVAPILEEAVSEKRLFVFPGKTAKGKPRYWDRDAQAITREAALAAMQEADAPITAKDLGKRVDAPLKLGESELTAILDDAVASGTLHAIPKATAKGKPRYWNQDVVAYGRLAIREMLRTKGAQSEAALKKAAKGLTDEQFRKSLASAIDAHEAWAHPPVGKSKKGSFGASPPLPEPYLREIGKQLGRVVSQLTAASVSHAELRRAFVQMAEAAGVSIAGEARAGQDSPPARAVPTFDLIAQMKRIEPGAERGALVRTDHLRDAAKLGKSEFDRAVMELARQGRLSLHRHDYVSSLSEQEREKLVSDGNGTYYVGMVLRHG